MATIPEITDRLEAATEKAENASQIIYDVANGDASTEVPTASGPTPTLKKWFQDLGSEVEPMLAGIPARLDKAVLVYQTKAEADAAAPGLPDGQIADVLETQERYGVQAGVLVFQELLRAYRRTGIASAVKRALDDKLGDVVNLKDFGAICDGALHPLSERFSTLAMAQVAYPHASSLTDSVDWAALQAFIDWAKNSGIQKTAYFSGTLISNKEITWRSHAYLRGDSRYTSVLKKAAGYNGRHIVSENFDALTGTASMTDPRTPYDFGLWEVTIDGQYIDAAKTTYTNTSGGGVFLYATGYQLKARILSQAGVGVWLECTGAEDWSSPRQRQTYVNLTIGNTAEESLIFKGPSDVQIEAINAYGAAAITATDPRNYTLWSSSTYPTKGRIDAIVFEQGCELDVMHTFGHSVGYGLFISSGRFNADLVISESNLGALDYSGSAYGQINRIRGHNIKGGVAYVDPPHPSAGTMPSVRLRSSGFLDIGSLMLERNGSGQTGQTDLLIENGWNTIGSVKCNGFGKAGHVIKSTGGFSTIDGVLLNNVKGTAADGTASCGFIREHANNASTFCNIKGSIVNTDEGFRSTNSVRTEKIDLQMTTVGIPFSGSQKAHLTQDWKISSTNTSLGETKTTTWYGAAAFDSTSTAKQTLTLTHTLIYAPPLDRITLGLDDSPTSFADSGGALDFIVVRDRTATTIVVDVKMRTATAVNTTPRVVVRAEL